MQLYFVRHGQTELNLKNAYYGWMDVSLTDCGKNQAAITGDLLSEIKFDEVWTSDLKRAEETVSIIMDSSHIRDAKNIRIRHFPDFREMNFGKWEGLDYTSVLASYPDDFKRWSKDWKYVSPTDGECFKDFYNRVKSQFLKLVRDDDPRKILIASHNGTMRVLFAVMLGLSMDGTWHFNFEQDAYSVVDFEYGNYTVRRINSREKF